MLKLTHNGVTYRVKWQHFPETTKDFRAGTTCEVLTDNDVAMTYGFGESFVHKWDKFDKEMGRRISLGRALKNLGLPIPARKALLSLYEHRG